jgi:hypothetical protein
MLKQIVRTAAISATLLALVTPAFARTPTGTDPEPGIVQTILVFLGMA